LFMRSVCSFPQQPANLRDERDQLFRVLLLGSKFAIFHPLLVLLGNHRALQVGRTFPKPPARSVPKTPLQIFVSYLLERLCLTAAVLFLILFLVLTRGSGAFESGEIFLRHSLYRTIRRKYRHLRWDFPRWDFPRYHSVTPEAKSVNSVPDSPAAENDEASTRILHELREALHKNYERLRREVAREMERECRFQKEDTAAD
jgi:hypothetical protein